MTTTPTFWSAEFLVNTNTTSSQDSAKVTALADGGFVICWRENDPTQDPSGDSSIKIQRFDASGAKVGAEFSRTTADPQSAPDIIARADGGFAIIYNRQIPGNPNVIFDSFDPNNTYSTGFSGTASAGGQQAVAQLVNGNIVAVWHSNGDNIVAYSRDALGGTSAGNLFTVNAGTADSVNEPAVAALANGGYVIAWDDDTNGLLEFRVFSSTDTPVTGDIVAASVGDTSIQQPALAGLANGNFILTWTATHPGGFDAGNGGVYGQIFTPFGGAASGEILINTTTNSTQSSSEVTALADGGFMVVWQDSSQTGGDTSSLAIRGQRYDESFNRVGSEFLINQATNSAQSLPDVTVLTDGRLVVVWQDLSGGFDPSGSGVIARIIDPRDHIINGDNGNDLIYGRQGDSIINGLDGDDVLIGMNGDDVISGGAGDDTLRGGAGNNQMSGGSGNDLMVSGADADIFNGGSGTDTVSYESAAAGVVVDLFSFTINTGEAANDTFSSVENLTGSQYGDSLRGDAGANRIFGGMGNDTLAGRNGDDTLIGNGGNDLIKGGSGNDIIRGADGADKLYGEAGSDVFVFRSVTESGLFGASDRIQDFVVGVDQIDLVGVAATPLTMAIGGSFSGIAPSAFTFEKNGTTSVYVDVDGNGTADMRIIVIGTLGLLGTDFLL